MKKILLEKAARIGQLELWTPDKPVSRGLTSEVKDVILEEQRGSEAEDPWLSK